MSYLASDKILTRIKEVLVDSLGTLRNTPAAMYKGNLPDGLEDQEESRRTSTGPHVEADIVSMERSPSSPPTLSNFYLSNLTIEVRIVRPYLRLQYLNDAARRTLKGMAIMDGDIIRQALEYPGNLSTTLAGDATGIVSGLLIYQRSDIEILGRQSEGTGTISTVHTFTCTAKSTPTVAPVAAVAPVISGVVGLGNVLTSTQGTWLNVPVSFAYQWYANGVAIPGATGTTYQVASPYDDDDIYLIITASNIAGSTPSQSNTLVGLTPPVISISGNVVVGGTLTATGTNISSYQWRRGNTLDGVGSYSNIASATNSTYTPVKDDIGYSLVCVGTNIAGSTTSNALIYNPATVSAVVDFWKISSLTPGSVSSIVGGKAGTTFTAAGSNRPTAGASSFNGRTGLTFDGIDDLMSALNLIMDSSGTARIVFGAIVNPGGGVQVLLELGPNYSTNQGSFAVGQGWNGAYQSGGTQGSVSYGGGTGNVLSPISTAFLWSQAHDSSNNVGVSWFRQNGVTNAVVPFATGNASGPFSQTTLNLGARASGSFPFLGVMGGVIFVMNGAAIDADLITAEAYCSNHAGL